MWVFFCFVFFLQVDLDVDSDTPGTSTGHRVRQQLIFDRIFNLPAVVPISVTFILSLPGRHCKF